jgi:Mg-chelatase subunit ChlD
LPDTVAPREPFQYSVWVHADRDVDGKVAVYRDGEPIAADAEERRFAIGMNRLLFRDLLEEGGLHRYEVRLTVDGDPVEENNRGAGVVRVDAGPHLLVLNADGSEDNLVRALRAARLPVDVAISREHSLTAEALDRYRAVLIENVPAADFGRLKMERLAQFVEDLGGGLALTGGERSFGTGGYFKSPLDEVLPVSMEMREEHRKNRLAMAIALDRSGSMAVPVKGGKVKMDLANLGTAEAIRLLSPGDSVAVIAVDSSPHVIQKLTPVEDPESLASRVKKIQSEGGGIFVYEALVAAGRQLMEAEQSTKHIILFSDANDSEEPGDYKKLLEKYEQAGITTSVIGLGKPTDVDSKLLEDIAKRGHGNIMFTEDPEELPRLFAQDTMSVARSSFVKKDPATQPAGIPGEIVPGARLMGEFPFANFPAADGYNLSYLKPEATEAVASRDEYAAPWSAFWFRGLGRALALTLEVDGPHTGAFGQWEDFADCLVTHARWLLGGDDAGDVFVKLRRDGQEAVVTVELDPDRPQKTHFDSLALSVLAPSDEREQVLDVPFQWTGAQTLECRFRLLKAGTYRTLIRLGGRNIVRGPAVTLPYSPEFMPRVGLPAGRDLLEAMASLTQGRERVDVLEALADPPFAARATPLLPWLVIAALVLVVTEIAGRRLMLWSWKRAPAIARPAETEALAPQAGRPVRRAFASAATRKSAPQPAQQPPAAAPAAPAADKAAAVFEQAKRRARKRLAE